MKRFWRFLLNKNLPPTSLGATSVAVFGLGDSGAFCPELLGSSYIWLYLEVTKQKLAPFFSTTVLMLGVCVTQYWPKPITSSWRDSKCSRCLAGQCCHLLRWCLMDKASVQGTYSGGADKCRVPLGLCWIMRSPTGCRLSQVQRRGQEAGAEAGAAGGAGGGPPRVGGRPAPQRL